MNANCKPARTLWVELSTRITTERLHFRSGNEETAAESIHSLFGTTRELLDDHPEAEGFQELALTMLNKVLRPYTARWHGWMTEDMEKRDSKRKPILKFRDEWVRRQFRRELRELQPRLIGFREAFSTLKSGRSLDSAVKALNPNDQSLVKGKESESSEANLGASIKFGIKTQIPITVHCAEKPEANPDKINKAELGEISGRRKKAGLESGAQNAVGLALSGGGIRSATYSLGIVQVLARRGLLKHFDYLSTVSGGGYLGAFMSAQLGAKPESSGEKSGVSNANSNSIDEHIERTFGKSHKGNESEEQAEPDAVRHLRNRSRYLVDGGFYRTVVGAGLVIAGILFNLLIVLPIPVFAALLTYVIGHPKGLRLWGGMFWADIGGQWIPPLDSLVSAMWFASTLILGLVLLAFPAAKRCSLRQGREGSGESMDNWNRVFFLALTAFAGITLLCAIPAGFHVYYLLRSGNLPFIGELKAYTELVTGMSGTLATLIFVIAAIKTLPTTRVGTMLNRLAIFSGPLLLLFVYFGVGYRLMFAPEAQQWSVLWVFIITSVVFLWTWLFVDVNSYSPHGYYRDRLSQCYLLHPKDLSATAGAEFPSADNLLLSELNSSRSAPYHLINSTVNLPTSEEKDLRGRNGDFFLFSKKFCGSPICGYHPTEEVEKADKHLDLGTAMAISGAAASSNMGWQTSNAYRMAMTIANVRLGYWIRNLCAGSPSGPGVTYLFREMFSVGMDEKQKHLNISDGGHIENLATYELLRRRCKFIVCVDGGMEPGMECADLMRLERYAAIDLGIKMHYALDDLMVQSNGYSKAYGTLIKIDYEPSKRSGREAGKSPWGWMLYIKLAMVGYGPGYVMDYEREHPEFPHQTTADQIYDEAQFEAYRALGEAAIDSFFEAEIIGEKEPATIEDWFKGLASNLLPDNDEAFRSDTKKPSPPKKTAKRLSPSYKRSQPGKK